MLLFKYRSSREFNYLVDIVLRDRLYAASYLTLNDPLEGHYTHDGNIENRKKVELLKGEKKKLRICSLSETSEDALMWAHYADGSRGMVIEVDILRCSTQHEVKPISYKDKIPDLDLSKSVDPESVRDVLSHKLSAWAYEKEHRVFTNDDYVNVKIKRIILGAKMPKEDESLIIKLIECLGKNISVDQADARGKICKTL